MAANFWQSRFYKEVLVHPSNVSLLPSDFTRDTEPDDDLTPRPLKRIKVESNTTTATVHVNATPELLVRNDSSMKLKKLSEIEWNRLQIWFSLLIFETGRELNRTLISRPRRPKQSPPGIQDSSPATTTTTIPVSPVRFRIKYRVFATAILYFRRFCLNNHLGDFDPRLVAMTAMVLALKVEEAYFQTSPHWILQSFTNTLKKHIHEMHERVTSSSITATVEVTSFMPAKGFGRVPFTVTDILNFEYVLFEQLVISLICYHPHRPLWYFLNDMLRIDHVDWTVAFTKCAWQFCNDSYLSDVSLRYPPSHIAVACIVMAGIFVSIEEEPVLQDWYKKQTWVDFGIVADIILRITDVYVEMGTSQVKVEEGGGLGRWSLKVLSLCCNLIDMFPTVPMEVVIASPGGD